MKQSHEMTKPELRTEIVWVKKQLFKFRKGGANDYEYEDYQGLISWRELANPFIDELKKRGLTAADQQRINSFYDEYVKAQDMMDERHGLKK